ncbi:chorismate mutase [Ephemerocybe angulata]|uniref:Chorismate mutase n=1 Tax=Ephemerocybe angulata TaxID=980116 RepID=A0A8H6HRZ3_9AGAR|nr:chorismate mutase [Tulosesus angulatus]
MSRILYPALASLWCLLAVFASARSVRLAGDDFAKSCYREPLPDISPSSANRTVPWDIARGPGECCSSLDEVRAGIDKVDADLLMLLSQRAALVREATRFKPTRSNVDVPSRDTEVINGAVEGSVKVNLPEAIARAVFTAIINSSVDFELCIFDAFNGGF